MQPNFEALRLASKVRQISRSHRSSQMKKKKAHRNRLVESKFLFDNKYPIPDLKYPILESESIFDSQP